MAYVQPPSVCQPSARAHGRRGQGSRSIHGGIKELNGAPYGSLSWQGAARKKRDAAVLPNAHVAEGVSCCGVHADVGAGDFDALVVEADEQAVLSLCLRVVRDRKQHVIVAVSALHVKERPPDCKGERGAHDVGGARVSSIACVFGAVRAVGKLSSQVGSGYDAHFLQCAGFVVDGSAGDCVASREGGHVERCPAVACIGRFVRLERQLGQKVAGSPSLRSVPRVRGQHDDAFICAYDPWMAFAAKGTRCFHHAALKIYPVALA